MSTTAEAPPANGAPADGAPANDAPANDAPANDARDGAVTPPGPATTTPPSRSTGPARRLSMSVHDAAERLTRWAETLPLRVRLVALVVLLMLAALLLTTAATSVLLHHQLLSNTDRDLHVQAVPVTTAAFEQRLAQHLPDEDLPTPYAVVVMPVDGDPQFFVPGSLARRPHPVLPSLGLGDRRVRTGEAFTVPSSDGSTDWRVVAGYATNHQFTVAVAVSLDPVEDTVARLLILETLSGLTVIAACAVLGWYAVRRTFKPLTQIEDTAAAIATGDLTRRVPELSAKDEVSSLSHSLNTMLAQIEASFAVREASEQRMREFVADASHELRTPLAAVRGYAELFRQGAVRPDDVPGAMRRIEDEATRMGGLVEDMLLLTRLDQQRPLQTAPVDLTVLAADAAQDARAFAPDRSITVVGLGGPLGPTMVDGDDARLRQVVTNLVANAVHHTPAGTPVEISVGPARATTPEGSGSPRSVLEVRDHGEGVDPQLAHKVFERFFRGDPSRVRRSGGGNGLGLAIVAAIVSAHHGKVGVAPTPGGGATFVVDLPSSEFTANAQSDLASSAAGTDLSTSSRSPT